MQDYKKEMIAILEQVSKDGLEGAIPSLIAESVKDAHFEHSTNKNMLDWTAYHCRKYKRTFFGKK